MKAQSYNITEKEFESQVRDLARMFHWLYYHTWRSIHSPAGFPDICMVRLSRIVFAELKSEKCQISPEQQKWLDALVATGRIEAYLWRPSNFDEIVECLR